MIRVPELKKQAAMLEAEIAAAMQSPLQHSVALEIVAKLNAFKNWRHAASAAGPVQEVKVTEPVAPAPGAELALVFGREDVSALDDNDVDPESLDTYEVKQFGTEAEKNAYLQGLGDGNGWTDYQVVTDEVKEFLSTFAFGENVNEILSALKAAGFKRGDFNCEFNRCINPDLEPALAKDFGAYQFIIFQDDDANGGWFVNMDCALTESGEYLTETSLFRGKTVLQTLQTALASADKQRDVALQEIENMRANVE